MCLLIARWRCHDVIHCMPFPVSYRMSIHLTMVIQVPKDTSSAVLSVIPTSVSHLECGHTLLPWVPTFLSRLMVGKMALRTRYCDLCRNWLSMNKVKILDSIQFSFPLKCLAPGVKSHGLTEFARDMWKGWQFCRLCSRWCLFSSRRWVLLLEDFSVTWIPASQNGQQNSVGGF